MGCEYCEVDTPKLHRKCEAIRIYAEKYKKKKEAPCGQCYLGYEPKFFPKKKHKMKRK